MLVPWHMCYRNCWIFSPFDQLCEDRFFMSKCRCEILEMGVNRLHAVTAQIVLYFTSLQRTLFFLIRLSTWIWFVFGFFVWFVWWIFLGLVCVSVCGKEWKSLMCEVFSDSWVCSISFGFASHVLVYCCLMHLLWQYYFSVACILQITLFLWYLKGWCHFTSF